MSDFEMASINAFKEIRLLLALEYVPENHVIDAFEELIDSPYYTDNENILQPLIDYIEDTWIGRPMGRRKGRRSPKYSISLWNCYESASTLLPRANNAVEGWHRGFSSLLGAYHPTLFTFIDVLKDQQHLEDIKLEQFIAGAKKHQKKILYKNCSEKIRNLTLSYNINDNINYLKGIAYNLTLQM
ncbi:unnamed protein product [Macrosiphum euphorbiae]|uniref:MULE transposase domain-containing protein n=1 Tax=Macrosiphum euphorbiae TaxID=13131 RepID=A0AAV0Y701_9HEMI|nr:unnamed protein product [Macrosiphum euphorbiae]